MDGEERATQAEDWQRVPAHRRKEIVGAVYVDRDITTEIVSLVDKVRAERRYVDEPTCVLITGETGTGKSTMKRRYASRTPPRRINGVILRPVLQVEMPVRATLDSSASAILECLGDPGPHRGKFFDKNRRVVRLLKEQHVDLVMIDEFQHIVEASGDKTLNKVGDWLKQIAKGITLPFVLFGMPSSAGVIGANSQFAGICPHHLSLGGFGYQTASERRAFRQFLATFDSMLPFNQLAMLGEQHTAQALFVATRGSLRPLVRLLREAAFCAIDRATPAIGSEDLALGFESIEAMVGGAQNPFTGMLG